MPQMSHGERSGQIGPDLSAIGKKASGELARSILIPSKAIADQYVSHRNERRFVSTGLVMEETGDQVLCATPTARTRALTRRKSPAAESPTSLRRRLDAAMEHGFGRCGRVPADAEVAEPTRCTPHLHSAANFVFRIACYRLPREARPSHRRKPRQACISFDAFIHVGQAPVLSTTVADADIERHQSMRLLWSVSRAEEKAAPASIDPARETDLRPLQRMRQILAEARNRSSSSLCSLRKIARCRRGRATRWPHPVPNIARSFPVSSTRMAASFLHEPPNPGRRRRAGHERR